MIYIKHECIIILLKISYKKNTVYRFISLYIVPCYLLYVIDKLFKCSLKSNVKKMLTFYITQIVWMLQNALV